MRSDYGSKPIDSVVRFLKKRNGGFVLFSYGFFLSISSPTMAIAITTAITAPVIYIIRSDGVAKFSVIGAGVIVVCAVLTQNAALAEDP